MATFNRSQVADATAQFGLKFMNNTAMDNVIMSPYSLQNLLIMIILGATNRSSTQKDLFKVLGYDNPQVDTNSLDSILENSRKPLEDFMMTEKMESIPGPRFSNADLVATNKDRVQLSKSYNRDLQRYFNIKAIQYSSSDNQSKSPPAVQVNNWVANKTNNLIKEIVEASDFNSDTMMILLDATYFKGSWLHKFYKSFNMQETFYNQGSKGVTVSFMHRRDKYGYTNYTQLDCQVLESHFLPEGSMSMVILLPSKPDGLDELQSKLTGPMLSDIYSKLKVMEVDVTIPKFTFESSLDAKTILTKMGADLALSNKAEFGRMFEKAIGQPTIDKMLHKARIGLDENGVEAAAVTSVSVVALSAVYSIQPPPEFIANHPFLFVVRHEQSNLPLFMGRVSKL